MYIGSKVADDQLQETIAKKKKIWTIPKVKTKKKNSTIVYLPEILYIVLFRNSSLVL